MSNLRMKRAEDKLISGIVAVILIAAFGIHYGLTALAGYPEPECRDNLTIIEPKTGAVFCLTEPLQWEGE